MDVRMFTVGPVQENCFIARPDGSTRAVIFDPGVEPERIGPMMMIGRATGLDWVQTCVLKAACDVAQLPTAPRSTCLREPEGDRKA